MEKKTWIVVGDIHDDPGNFAKIPELKKADGIIVTGDLTMLGGPQKARLILEQLGRSGKPVLAQIGNMDKPDVNDWLSEAGMNLHDTVRELAPDVAVFGIGGSTATPFATPSEFPESAYATWLNEMWPTARNSKHTILVSHNPPKNTVCDDLGHGVHVGSEAVREFIEENQPSLCLCGHIHEAKGEDQLGRTKVINPGQLNQGGYIVLQLQDGKLTAELREVES